MIFDVSDYAFSQWIKVKAKGGNFKKFMFEKGFNFFSFFQYCTCGRSLWTCCIHYIFSTVLYLHCWSSNNLLNYRHSVWKSLKMSHINCFVMMGHDVARLRTAQCSAVPCRAITHSKQNLNFFRQFFFKEKIWFNKFFLIFLFF